MEFGYGVPTRGPQASPEALATLARQGEALGYDIVSVSDHVVIPRQIASRYPYSESGTFGGGGDGACLEQLTLLAYLAAHTSRLRLLTSVMVVPHRSAVLAAKVLASIDVLSGGRLIVGCGVGWMREEFEALGAPPYDHRGTVSDEYIQAFRELWTKESPAYAGEYVSFSDIAFAPKPVQSSGPPIWVGGESPAALRRAGRLGDAWYPIGSNPSHPLATTSLLKEAIATVHRHAEEAGRDPATMDFAYSAGWYDDREAHALPDGSRQPFTGVPEQIAEDIRSFEDLGIRHMTLGLMGPTLEDTLERMEWFAKDVRPLVEA